MLSLQNIFRSFDNHPVLQGIDLTILQGEIICLLGASGSGKTSLLRIIAGLEQPDSGDVRLKGASILALPPHQREFGLMFQDFALFPHMNVAQNIIFGLRMRGVPNQEQQSRLREVLDLVGLVGFEKRDVAELSGGEKQRVALARSIAPNPPLLMLDEPLGSLDAALRDRLVVDLRAIIKKVGLTAIYVTHDQHEAFAIADRIAVMNAGKIEQIGTPESLYHHPKTAFVARFLGLDNVVPVLAQTEKLVSTPLGDFTLADSTPTNAVLLHPNGIRLAQPTDSRFIAGTVIENQFTGDDYQITLSHQSGIHLSFKLNTRDHSRPEIGETMNITIAPATIIPMNTV